MIICRERARGSCKCRRVSYMCTTHTLELEGPDDVGGQFLGVGQCHAHHAVRLRAPARPVLKRNWNIRTALLSRMELLVGNDKVKLFGSPG